MSTRAAVWLAWSLAGLALAMFVAGVAFALLSVTAGQPSSAWSLDGNVGKLLIFVPFLAFPIVGVLIASRRPENSIGWICLTAGLFWMLIVAGDQYHAYELARTDRVQSFVTLGALTQWMWVPSVGLLGIYLILLFPDGRLPSRRWRPLAWFSGAVIALISVAITLTPGPLPGYPGVRNPFGLEGLEGLERRPWLTM